jgi:hypothetical protein
MPEYAVIKGGQFVERRNYPQAIAADKIRHTNGVPDLRPYTEVRPAFDATAETLDGPVYTITNTLVTATWTKRNLTAQELSDKKDEAVASLNGGFGPLTKALLSLHNRVRVLEGLPTHTMAQFKTGLKALL